MSYTGLKYKHTLILIVLILIINNFVSPTYTLRKRQDPAPPPPPGPCKDCLAKCCTDFCPAGGTCPAVYDTCDKDCGDGVCGPIDYTFDCPKTPPSPAEPAPPPSSTPPPPTQTS